VSVLVGDLPVSRIGYGSLHLTGPGMWGPPADPAAAQAVVRRAVELGVTFIDTAESYGPGTAEEVIAEALHPYPDDLVIATKCGLDRDGPELDGFEPWPRDARPERLREACEGSLRRLRLDTIPLYQLHAPDPKVPLEEAMGTLAELQREGKVRHIGVSNVTVAELERARAVVEVVSVQNRYSLGAPDDEVLAACERHGLAFLPWYPLAGGELLQPGGPLDQVAARHGASRSQVALAWLLARSPLMLPIPGTRSIAHLEDNVAALGLTLDADDLERLG
jgi:aryl-alcohol dehydrogenase-like predicted oxidoreductase